MLRLITPSLPIKRIFFMDRTRRLWQAIAPKPGQRTAPRSQPASTKWICTQCLCRPARSIAPGPLRRPHRRFQSSPADQPGFQSIVDQAPVLVRSGRKHNRLGLFLLAAIPATAFGLGCWQVQRLGWKTDLIAKFEDRLVRDPLPLPPQIDPDAVQEFDYRRVYARGVFQHDKEMLIGPRLHDGNDGYLVITPLERSGNFPDAKGNTTILVCRGWIPKKKAAQSSRPDGLPQGEVLVEGLLRTPWKKNMFTPLNKPQENKWYFPDVREMADFSGSQPVWIEETMPPDLLTAYAREDKGIPIGRIAEVNLRNNHAQYIFTWFSLSTATTVMLWMVMKKPIGGTSRRVRQSNQWS